MTPARQIVKPTPLRSDGVVNSSWVRGGGIAHESELDAAFVWHSILCPTVLSIHEQSFRPDWHDGDGVARECVPDDLTTLPAPRPRAGEPDTSALGTSPRALASPSRQQPKGAFEDWHLVPHPCHGSAGKVPRGDATQHATRRHIM